MEYKVYKYGQITKFEAGVIYKAYKNGEINCLPEFTKFMYERTEDYLGLAIQRYNQDSYTYDRIYDLTRNILAKDFEKANELVESLQNDFINLAGKKSSFYKYKKEEE